MKKLNKKGFTLIELLAVIVILGILMLIAIPSVTKYIASSREKTFKNTAQLLVDAVRNDVVSNQTGTCNANIADITLEKGNKENISGYISAEQLTTDGTYTYTVHIANTKDGLKLDGVAENNIEGTDAKASNVTAITMPSGSGAPKSCYE